MTNKLHGSSANSCDVCGRVYTWGCGHSGRQEAMARRHRATKKHAERRCLCYGHDHCGKECSLAGKQVVGYMPFYQHKEAS